MGNMKCCSKRKQPEPLPHPKPSISVRTPSVKNDYFTAVTPEGRTVVAVFSYQARDSSELSFVIGDTFVVLNDRESDWWQAYHIPSRREGSIPSNYVREEESYVTEEWFFDKTTRKDSEKLLHHPSNMEGTFLIRKCENAPGCHALSIKCKKESGDAVDYEVKHYKIRPLDNGGCYLSPSSKFANIQDLIAFYSVPKRDFPVRLTKPCRKTAPHQYDLSKKAKDIWEIDRNQIKLIKKIGGGNFGVVYHGKFSGSVDVAVKTLKTETAMSKNEFLEEAKLMKELRHINLVALYAVSTQEEPYYIVTEFMKNGSLLDYLRGPNGRNITINIITDMATQIAFGMKYLEAKKLVHRDLAARNILVGELNEVKIADFGLARIIGDEVYSAKQGSKFPTKWTAPEALARNEFTCKSDVWSYGVLLMEMITLGEHPYPGMGGEESFQHVSRGYRMPKPVRYECPDPIYDTMLKCWETDPEKRPTFEYLHSYFDDFPVSSEEAGYRNPEDVL